MTKLSLCLSALLLPLGCSRAEQPKPAPRQEPTVAHVDARDQYALASALESAQAAPPKEQAGRYAGIRAAWQGQRYRWEARFEPLLCTRADSCVVIAFDASREKDKMIQGWLPRLELDEKSLSELKNSCSAHRRCVVTFEGTLSRLAVSPELPTTVSFDHVHVIDARDEAAGESWGLTRRS